MKKEKKLQKLIGSGSQTSVSDRLYQRISGLILSGELEEGYTFPNETVLCEELQVGRTSLREAYKALELTGYVTRTKRGTVVNGRSEILRSTPLRSLFHSASETDFSRFRIMIESKSASLAAEYASESDIEMLDRLMKRSEDAKAREDFEELMNLDEQFHTGIARMSGNPLISSIVAVMAEEWHTAIQRNFLAAVKNNRKLFDIMLSQHSEIIEAVRNHEPKASVLMEEHIRSVTIRT